MTNQLFDPSKVKKGALITVKFENGKKRSGIVTEMAANQLTYRYFDEGVELIQAAILTREGVEEGSVSFITADHLGKDVKTEAKASDKSEATMSFFNRLGQVHNIDKLIRVFKNEDAQTLALIASFLNPKTRLEFLYRLPDDVFARVDNMMKNVSHINQDVLTRLEAQLEAKFNQYKEEKKTEKKTSSEPNFDPFGGLLGGLLGGNPADLLKNFNPNDIKNIFGEGMKQENQPPLPNADQMREMLENMPKMLNELFGNLNNQDDDDDDYPRKPKF